VKVVPSPGALATSTWPRLWHQGEWFPGRHDPIVDPEVFTRVQEILDENTKGRRPKTTNKVHDYLLTGLLHCGISGYALTTAAGHGRGGKKYPYYRRTSAAPKVDDPKVISQMPAIELEEMVLAVLEAAGQQQEVVERAVEEAQRLAREEGGPRRERLESLRGQLRSAEEEGDRTLDQLLALGVADSTTAKRRLTALEQRQGDLRRGIGTLEAELSKIEGNELDHGLLVEALRDFRGLYDRMGADDRKDALRLLVRRIDVFKQRLRVELHDGCDAGVRLRELRAKGRKQSLDPQNDEMRTTEQRFAFRIDWLSVADAYRKFLAAPSADGIVQLELARKVSGELELGSQGVDLVMTPTLLAGAE
jgi:hypothetical protein